MKDLTSLCLTLNSTVKDGIAQINKNGKKCVFIVDDADRLCGLLTDGDVRRYVLSGEFKTRNGSAGDDCLSCC